MKKNITPSPHPDETQLTALLFEEAPDDVGEHVRACPICQSRLAEMIRFDAEMEALAQRFTCPSPEQLIRYAEGKLSPIDRARIQKHIRTCAFCSEELAVIQHYDSPEEEKSSGWWVAMVDGVRRWFQAQPALELSLTPQPAPRGDRASHTWRYHTPEFDVILTSSPVDDERADWMGQIIPLEQENTSTPRPLQGRVILDRGDGDWQTLASIEEGGSFSLLALPQGPHRLLIAIDPDVLIEIDIT